MAFNTAEEEREKKLKILRDSLTQRQEKIEELFVEKKVVDEYEIKQPTRFHTLPKEVNLCIEALKFTMDAPLELSLQALMATINFAASGHYDIDPIIFGKKKKVTTNEFFMNLAPSGGGKTTIYEIVNEGVDRFEQDERVRYAKEMSDYKILKARWTNMRDKILKNTKDDLTNIEQQMADLGLEPETPIGWQYTIPTGTRNFLINVLDEVPFARFASDEGGEFFNGHTMGGKETEKAMEMITSLSKLWSGGIINRGTGKKDDVAWIANRRLTMFFMLQPSMAKFLSMPIYTEQGFIHRFLITHCNEDEMPDIDIDRVPAIKEMYKQMEPFHNRIYELLKKQKHIKEGTTKELDLPYYAIEDDAFRLVQQYSNDLKRQSRTGEIYNDWKGFTKRTFEHVIRLSANLACFEGKESVDINSMAAGIELFEFYLQQRVTLVIGADSKFSSTLVNSDRFLNWFNKKTQTETELGVPKKWITQNAPEWFRKHLSRIERNQVIEELVDRGDLLLEIIDNKTIIKRS